MMLRKLFGWQHGADSSIRLTVVLRYTPAGGGQPVELEAQLAPPGRDDAVVQARRQEGRTPPKVDGYRMSVRGTA